MPTQYEEDVAESRARETAEVTAFRDAYAATLKLAKDLRETRSGLGMSQEELAKLIGVAAADIGRIEHGEIDSDDTEVIARMVRAMGRELEPLRIKVSA